MATHHQQVVPQQTVEAFIDEKAKRVELLSSTDPDKSRAGGVDRDVVTTVEAFNGCPDVYTTSSCAGRVIVVETPPEKGYTTNWLFVTHDVDYNGDRDNKQDNNDNSASSEAAAVEGEASWRRLADAVWACLGNRKNAETGENVEGWEVWLKMEPFLISLSTRTVERARRLIGVSRQAGCKRAYITAVRADGSCIVHVADTNRIEVPLSISGEVVATREYVDTCARLANEKMHATRKRLAQLEAAARTILAEDKDL